MVLLASMCVLRAQATYTMTNNDTLFIYPCLSPSGIIYDDGGANGSYSNNFEGWAILTVPSGVSISLAGSYETESCCDKIWVYDGHGPNGTALVNGVGGTGSINVTSSTGVLSVRFHSDGSISSSGFVLSYSVVGTAASCQNAVSGLAASSVTDTSAVLSWSAVSASGPFTVLVGDTTLTVSDTTLSLSGLNPNTHYDVTVSSTADLGSPCCMARGYFRTLCGVMRAPVVEAFDDYGAGPDVLPACWTRICSFDDTNYFPQVSSAQSSSPSGSLLMGCGSDAQSGHWALAIGPEVSGDITSFYVRFKIRCGYQNAKLEVGVCSDTGVYTNNFVPLDTIVVGTANSWLDKVVSLASYTGNGNRIALRMIRSLQPANALLIYVDDLNIETCGVWHQTRNERATTDMWLSWDLIGSPTVDIEVGAVGFVAGTGTAYTDVTSPYHLTGLEPGTQYQVRFYTTCNGIHREQTSLTVATLAREASGVNLCEDFESNGNNLPAGWRRLNIYDGSPSVTTSSYYGGTRSLYLRSYGATHPMAILPLIDTVSISDLMVSFRVRSSSYATGHIEVGVIAYPEYATSFVPVDTVDVPMAWAQHSVRLTDYAGSGKYVALRAYDNNSNYNYIYLDNLEVGPCLVTGKAVTNIASHSVDLLWDTVGSSWPGDSVTVEYGVAGFGIGTGTVVRVPVSGSGAIFDGGKQKLSLTGLDTNTAYQFLIYGECTGLTQVCDMERLSATTLQSDPALPFCESFESYSSGTLPAGWSRPMMYDGCPKTDNGHVHTGNMAMRMRGSGSLNNSYSVLALPMLDVDSLQGLTVSFFAYGDGNGYGTKTVEVGVMTNPNDESTFTVVGTRTVSNNTWKSYTVSMESYTGTSKYLAFRYYNSSSAWIDDIVVSDAATNNRTFYSLTSHGVTMSWTDMGRSYNGAVIEWGPAGFTQGSGTRDTVDANTFTYTVDTLQTGTTYNFFITALSSETADICNYLRSTITTSAEPMQASWCYGFEDVANGGYPTRWTRPQTYENRPVVYSDAHSGSRALYLQSYNCGNTVGSSMAAMPYLEEESLDGLTLHFWAKASGDYNEALLLVGMLTHPNQASSFDTIVSLNLYNGGQWTEYSVDLSSYGGAGRHLVFWQVTPTSCRSSWVYLDDLSINRCRVKDVMSYSATTSSFVIGWTTEGTADSVELEYGPQGFTPGSGTIVGNVTAPYTLTGLTLGTAYDYYLRPYCAGSDAVCSEAKHTASTLSTPIAAGFCEDMEGYNIGARPAGWSVLKGYDSQPYIWYYSEAQYYTSSNGAFEFRCAPTGSNLVVLPAAEEALSGLVMSFNMRCSDAVYPERPTLIVGAMTIPYDSTTFVAVDTLHPTWNYKPVTVDFSSYSGTGSHIAFRYYDDGYRYTYIDDLRLSHSAVSDIKVMAVSDHSATLQWQRVGYSDTTWVAYDTAGGTNCGNPQPVLAAQLTLDSLAAGTSYRFYLWGSGQDTSLLCQATSVEVTTLDAPVVLPYCENFEGYTEGTMPTGWTVPYAMSGLQVQTALFAPNGGIHSLQMPASVGNNERVSLVAMPAIGDSSLSAAYVDFYLSADNYGMNITIGVMDDPYDTTTFTAVGQYQAMPMMWRHIKHSLASYTGTGRYLAFRASANGQGSGNVYIDDLNLRSCVVTQSALGSPTENSLTLTWAASTGANGVFVEYKSTGSMAGDFVPGSGTTVSVTESPYTFTGLEEATYYTFHVYPACDSASDGCNYDIVSMQTLHPWVGLPYCENFEEISDAMPNNWVALTSGASHSYTGTGHNDSSSYYVSLQADGSGSALFALPRIYIGQVCTTIDKMYANFWLQFGSDSASTLFEVGTMTDVNDASTFTPHDTATYKGAGWQHYTLPITGYNTANTYVAFRLSSTNGTSVWCDFDDLCMEKCVAGNVTVSEITQNTVTITWDNYSVDTLICEYGPQGFALGTGNVITITESPYTIENLTEGTLYDFTFASVCGCNQFGASYTPGNGSWGGSGGWGGYGWGWWCCVPCHYDTLQSCRYWRWGYWHGHSWSWWFSHTDEGSGHVVYPAIEDVATQAAMMEVPYCENFEIDDSIAFPPSWRRRSESLYPSVTTINNHNGEKSLRFYATTTNSCYAALPPLPAGDVQQMVVTFFAYSTSQYAVGSSGRLIAGVMKDPDDETTFFPIDTIGLNATATWEQHVVDFASYGDTGQYIAFRLAPTGGAYNLFIDDLQVGRCAASNVQLQTGLLSDLFAGSGGQTADPYVVKLSWTSHHIPDSLKIVYGRQDFTPGDSNTVGSIELYYGSLITPGMDPDATLDLAVNLTNYGIDPDSSYDFYITTVCDDTSSGCFLYPLTLNPVLLTPYCADFEDLPSDDWADNPPVLPKRWTVVRNNQGRPRFPQLEYQDEQNIIAFYPGTGSNDNVVMLPPLPEGDSLEGKWVYADFATQYNNSIFLDFGTLTDTTNGGSFVQMGSMSNGSNGEYKEMNVQLTAGQIAGDRFAIRARSTSGERWIRLNKIALSDYPYPLGVSNVAMGVAGRRISWSGANGNAYYTLEYGYGDTWQTVSSDSCQALLTGLEAGKEYTVNFISPSGERLCLPYRFTNDEYRELPYCENFDSYNSYIVPDEWYSYNSYNNDNYPRTYGGVYNSCCQTLDFYCNSSNTQYTALPDLAVDSVRHLDLQFSLRIEDVNNTRLVIGVMDDRTDPSTFTPVDTLSCPTNGKYYPQHINLASYQGTGRYVTFRFLTTSGSRTSLFIDDLTVSGCPLPDLSVYSASSIAATLPGGVEADYYIEYAPFSFVQGEGDTVWNSDSTEYTVMPTATTLHVTTNPFYLTGLTPATTYTLYMRCDSAALTCAPPVTLTTSDRVPMPYCDDFDSYDPSIVPPGWYSYSAHGDSYPRTYDYNFESCCRAMDFYADNSHLQYTALPDLDIDDVGNAEMYISLRIEDTNYTKLVVGVMEDRTDPSTFTPVDTLTCATSGAYYEKHVSFANYNGNGRFIALRILNSDGNRRALYVDNLRVQSCPRAAVTLSEGTTVKLEVDTTLGSPDYWVEYGPQGTTQMAEDTVWNSDSTQYTLQAANILIHVTESPYYITGLDENTTYDFYTRCDSATATCFPVQRITTTVTLALPLCYDFSSYNNGELPPCWQRYNNNNYYYDRPYKSNDYIEFYNYYVSNICQATLPDISIDSLKHLNVEFELKVNYINDGMIVGVMDSPTEISSFVPVDTFYCTSTGEWQRKTVRMYRYGGDGRFLAFREYNAANYRAIYMRNLRIQSCPRPTVSLCAGTTVRFDVDTTVSAPDYWIEYGLQGITQMDEDTVWNSDSTQFTVQPHNTLIHVTQTPYLLTPLAAGSTYDFFIRCDSAVANCYPVERHTTSNVLDLPQCFDFSIYGNQTMPPFWKRYSNDGSYPNYPYTYNGALRFYKYSTTSICQAVLPDFAIDSIKNLNLTFSMKVENVNDGLVVGVLSDADDPATFVAVDTLHVATTSDWYVVKPRLNLYSGSGRFVVLRELTTSTYRNVYANNFYVETCDIPATAAATLHGHNTVRIDADTTSRTGFWVEYDTSGFAQGTGTFLYCTALPLDLVLDNTTSYDFYFRCDTTTLTCRPKQTVMTMSEPQELPLCENFDSYGSGSSLPTGWLFLHPQSSSGTVSIVANNAHTDNQCLRFHCYYNNANYAILPDLDVDSLSNLALSFWLKGESGNSLTVGVVSDPTDASTFLPVQTVNCVGDDYVRYTVTLNSLPSDARFIALRSNTSTSSYWHDLYLDDLFIDTVGATRFRVTEIASDEVSFEWDQVGAPVMTIEYGAAGFAQGTGTIITVTSSPYTVTGLDPLTNHKFYFTAIGDSIGQYCTTNYRDSVTIFTPAGGTGCIDPTNFTAEYTRCFYGTYANPYANIGVVDYGAAEVASRHTVNFDTAARDSRTGNLLRVIPEGANASVRLGNWSSGGSSGSAEGEAVAYTLLVDTTSFDLLVLRYAAVLQNPPHDPDDQPRFSLEVLDSAGTLLDAQCAAADFVANMNLGWNIASGNVLWKDWTTVGVDLSPYAGQQVIIRLTTRDCAEGSHYGYAYFTVGCQQKNMKSELCGDVDSNTFYAPAGFAYRWYSSLDTLDTISTERMLKVATDTITYYCQCSFVDNANCQFTISAYAGTRYPLASFNYSVEISDCKFHVSFTNTSTISADGVSPIGSGEPCESALWDLGNGLTTNSYHATAVYDSAGTYNISLISGIADDVCTDTATLSLVLSFPSANYSIDGNQHLCVGDTTTLAVHQTATRLWSTGSTDTMLVLVPDTTTLYYCYITDSSGCLDTLQRLVNVYDVSYTDDHQTTVENDLPYTWNNRVYYNDTLDTITLSNIAGCDSTVHLSLVVYYNVTDTVADTLCESALPYTWNDSIFTATASKTTLLTAHTGADSLLTMQLYVIPTTYDTVFDTIVENNLPHTFLHHSYAIDTLGDTLRIVNAAGCDSIITYNLYVHRNVADTLTDTLCESQLPYVWNNRTFGLDSSYYDTLRSAFVQQDTLVASTGADSLLTMALFVIPTTYSTLFDTVVENDLPYTFLHHSYTADTLGDTLHTTNLAGCDSIITYNLHVFYNVKDTLYDTICEGLLPYTWNDSLFTNAASKTTLLAAASGADSLVTMHLFVIPTTYDTLFDTVVENDLPYTFLTHTYYSDTLGDTLHLLNAAGCDSIITYTLFVHRNVTDTVADTVCEGQLPYTWSNRTFELDSSYFDTLLSAFVQFDTLVASTGADSLLVMQLTVIPTTYSTLFDTVVENDLPVTFNGVTYSRDLFADDSSYFTSLLDTLTLLNQAGCDSVVTYQLSVFLNKTVALDSAVCATELPLTWNARTFTLDSSYFDTTIAAFVQHDTLTASTGADSILIMSLTVHDVYHWMDTLVVCRNQLPYTWRDTLLPDTTMSGDYFLARTSQFGCDSLMSLHLTMGEVYAFYDTLSVCFDAQPVTWLDTSVSIDSAGTFDVPLPLSTVLGCDSIYNLRLTLRPVYDLHDTVTLCENSLPYTWADTSVAAGSSSLTLQRFFTSSELCDSTRTLHLTVDTNTYGTVHEYIVENALPYTYHGMTFNGDTTGVQLVFDNAHGCDSIVTYSLTVYYNVSTQVESTVCDDALPYTWNGVTFAVSDLAAGANAIVKFDTLLAYTGADSVVMMTLHVNPTFSKNETLSLCYDALPYTWHDTLLGIDQTSATIQRHFLSQQGCDSSFTLQLTVSDVYQVTDYIVSCNPITWIDGNTYDSPTVGPQVVLQSQAGCDSVVVLNFTLVPPVYTYLADSFCTGDVYHFGDRDLTASGLYIDSLLTADNCDSIVSLQLTMLAYPSLTLTAEPDCQTYTYSLRAETNVDYFRWSVESSSWNNDWGQPSSHLLYVRPYGTQTFTAVADYREEPTCPVTKTISVSPIVQPLAIINAKPDRLNYEQQTLVALDQSTGAIWRQWWVNGDDFGTDVRIELAPDMQEDSVVLMLVVGSQFCTDTATQVIPIFRSSVFAPNAFTPNENSNKEFLLLLDGVVSYELTIYNRQGIEVFHSLNPEEGWDGTSKGRLCPQGAYVWILRYTTKEMPRVSQTDKGSVLLLR